MEELRFIEGLLAESADYVRERYAERTTVRVQAKSEDNDLLTEVDLAVQKQLVSRIQQDYPGDLIVGEEAGFDVFPQDPDARAWVLDPIDGTQNFVRGLFPHFGISVGLAQGGRPVAGGVALPITGDLFTAQQGAGAFRNGRRLECAATESLHYAKIEIDFSTQPDRRETIERFGDLMCRAGQVRCHCAAVVPLCAIAAGEMDAYLHVTLNPWDYAAGQIIIEEAGGRLSRLDGSPLRLFDGQRGVLASNGHVHDEIVELLCGEGRSRTEKANS